MGVGNLVGAAVGGVKGAMSGGFGGALKGAAGGLMGGGFGGASSMLAQGAQIFQGYQDSKNQNANLQDSRGRFDANQQLIQGQLAKNSKPGTGETGMQNFLGAQQAPTNYNSQQLGTNQQGPGQFNSQQIDANSLGIPSANQNQSFNASQDALMQMVNRSAAGQLGNAGVQLDDLATNGGKQDLTNLMGAMGQQQNANLQDQLAQQKGSVSGLGQLAGTAAQFAQGRTRNRAMIDNNTLNAQVQTQEMNNVNNRRLSAAGTLGGLNLQAGQNNISAANALTGLGQAQSQQDFTGAGLRLSAATANQGAALGAAGLNSQNQLATMGMNQQAGMANQSAGLAANAQNNQAGQAYGQQQLSGYNQLAGVQSTQNAQNAALIGLQVGQNAPQRQMGNPLTDALGQAPLLSNVYDRLNKNRSMPGATGGFNPQAMSPFSMFQNAQNFMGR